jgi:predicted aspartyl protease
MARLYEAFSFYKSAKQMIDRAYQLDPTDPEIQKNRLWTLSPEGQLKALQDYLAAETNSDPEDRSGLEQQFTRLQDRITKRERAPCRLLTTVSSMAMTLEPLGYNPKRIEGVGLKAKLNGTSAVLLLDTGATGILLDRKVAEKAGIKRIVEATIGGIGDKADSSGYIGLADTVQIGSLEFQSCYVRVIDKKFSSNDDGLIGADVFAHYLVDIDFPDGKLNLTELPARPGESPADSSLESNPTDAPRFYDQFIAPEMKSYTPILQFGHHLLIPTQVNDSTPRLFLIDSGGFDDSISPAFARDVTKVSGDWDAKVKGLSGAVKNVYRADNVKLHFSHFSHDRQRLFSFDTSKMSNDDGTEVSGILGFAMLRLMDVKIDYRDGLIDFQYDPDRWH